MRCASRVLMSRRREEEAEGWPAPSRDVSAGDGWWVGSKASHARWGRASVKEDAVRIEGMRNWGLRYSGWERLGHDNAVLTQEVTTMHNKAKYFVVKLMSGVKRLLVGRWVKDEWRTDGCLRGKKRDKGTADMLTCYHLPEMCFNKKGENFFKDKEDQDSW